MTEIFKFFNSAPGDPRTYQAADFADYFGSVLSTGLLHTDNVPGMALSVESGTLNTIVSAGKAIMKGHLYENTESLTLTHSIPEATLDRIDRVVLRLDLRNSERNIKLRVKEGVASASPVAPVLQRDNFIYEISLAQIRVRANTVQLLQTDLVDERLNEDLAGLVHSIISIPTDQLQTWITARIAELDIEADGFEQQLAEKLIEFENEYRTWFDNLQASGFATPESVQEVANNLTTHKADGVQHVTAQERTNWNGKQNALTISSSTTSTSTSVVANSLAVKTAMDRANSAFQSASDGKTAVASAVTAKGVAASSTDTFPTLATKIGQIATGKKFAIGNLTTDANGVITVTGLTFSPRYIIATIANNYYIAGANAKAAIVNLDSSATTFINATNGTWRPISDYGGYINSSGFKLVVAGYGGAYNCAWIAIE